MPVPWHIGCDKWKMQFQEAVTVYNAKIDGILRSSQRISTIADNLQSYSPLPSREQSPELREKVRRSDSLALSWSLEEPQQGSSNHDAEHGAERMQKLPPLQGPHALKHALRILKASERARVLQIDFSSTKSSAFFPAVVRANQILKPSALDRAQSLRKLRDRNEQVQSEMLRRFKWRRKFYHNDSHIMPFGLKESREGTRPIVSLDQLDNFFRESSGRCETRRHRFFHPELTCELF